MASPTTTGQGSVGFHGLTAAAPTSSIELSVSCRNIRDADIFSKSDPMCVLFIQEFGQEKWTEFGRTETIMNNLNPDFAKKFVMTYYFEETQRIKLALYDIDSASLNLADHDYLGAIETTLGEVVSMSPLTKPLLINGVQYGTITVTAEELSTCKEEITLQFMGKGLERTTFLFFNSAKPFLTFSKANENGTFTVVHRTEYVDSSAPVWKQFTLSSQSLCNGDYERVIKIQCHHYKMNGSHKFVGECFLTLNQITDPKMLNNTIELSSVSQSSKKSGTIMPILCQKNKIHTFIDYIRGGTELLCTVAIDFTSSNGDPRSPSSLHYMDSYKPNQYVQALRAVGEIIQDYDSDKLFPVLGFGARLPPDGNVSHEFFVNMNPTNPYCLGLDGILAAYHQCLEMVQLYGPTNFAPVINHVSRIARGYLDGSKYHILLIITDGIITDMAQTKEAIVNASSLPLSIIIVGVGGADFSAMEELDGDVVRLSSRGRYAERDIVQFVPFRDFMNGLQGVNYALTQAKLAKAVLAEVPGQFLSFMKKNSIRPSSPKQIHNLPMDPQLR